ncbi:hypothetical protein ES703_37106 [subsurface metagenome]
MAKPKTPLLSFGARGTIADSLTFQKRNQGTIARTKPIPTDPYTLAQAYQRWDYQDYAYLWTLQSEASKQTYRTRASRYHMTGFSLWMREHLRDLPDLAGRWHLDEKAGAIAYDSSKNNNHGTIIGASPVDGVIDGAYHFDGLNDRITIPNSPTLELGTHDFTFEFFLKCSIYNTFFLGKYKDPANRFYFTLARAGQVSFFLTKSPFGVLFRIFGTSDACDGLWHHCAVVGKRGNRGWVFLDGQDDSSATVLCLPDNADIQAPLYIGYFPAVYHLFQDDHFIFYNRALDATEIKRHSERRYPA